MVPARRFPPIPEILGPAPSVAYLEYHDDGGIEQVECVFALRLNNAKAITRTWIKHSSQYNLRSGQWDIECIHHKGNSNLMQHEVALFAYIGEEQTC